MKDLNKILNEKIKGMILELLMKRDLSFSEILKQIKLRDHGQLNYHLKSLINEGLIMKKEEKYSKTPLGERMGVYINQFQSKEMYPISVVCAIIKNENDEILLMRRAKSPQKGKWSFPGGKVALGENLSEAAEREVLEETGIKLKFEKVAGFFPSIVYNNNELSFHANLIPVLMKKISQDKKIIIDQNEHDSFKFFKREELGEVDLIANNKYILERVEDKGFCFEELIFKE